MNLGTFVSSLMGQGHFEMVRLGLMSGGQINLEVLNETGDSTGQECSIINRDLDEI